MGRLSIAALAVALVACDKGEDPNAPRHYTDAEIADLEARLMMRVDANTHQHCVRPVLDGEPRAGSARQAQLALLEPTDGTKTCVASARAAHGALDVKTPVHEAPAMWKVDDECGAIFERLVREAIAFEDACAPYISGVRVAPGSGSGAEVDTYAALSSISATLAARASRQEPVAGLRLVAAGIRWNHDHARGHTNLLQSMGALSNRSLIAVARPLIAAISAEGADEIAPAFDALIATAPRVGPLLLGDHELLSLHLGLAALKPVGWIPPGGASADWPRPDSSRDEAAQVLEQLDGKIAFGTRYCGDRGSLATCYTNYVSRLAENPDGAMWSEYVRSTALSLTSLIGLRLALEVRRTGRCPTADELEQSPYRALRSSVVLGDRVATTLEDGMLVIHPPAWAVSDRYRAKGKPITIECP